jgi:hypothetical protein
MARRIFRCAWGSSIENAFFGMGSRWSGEAPGDAGILGLKGVRSIAESVDLVEQVGGGVFCRQGDGHLPEPGEARVLVEDVPELCVHIQEIELTGAVGEGCGDSVDELREYV